MPFDYLHSDQDPRFEKHIGPHARDAHVLGLRERAAMLRRLGYSRDDTVRRLEQNVEWDFDKWAQKLPDFYEEIPAIVDAVYRRAKG